MPKISKYTSAILQQISHKLCAYLKIWRSSMTSHARRERDCRSGSRTKTYETKSSVVAIISRFQQHLEAHDRRTAIREVSNTHDAYAVAVMHDPGHRTMTASAVRSLSTLLIRCTVCEVVGASPQTSLSQQYVGSCQSGLAISESKVNLLPACADSRSSWPVNIFIDFRIAKSKTVAKISGIRYVLPKKTRLKANTVAH